MFKEIIIVLRGRGIECAFFNLMKEDFALLKLKEKQYREPIEYLWFQKGFFPLNLYSTSFSDWKSASKENLLSGLIIDNKGGIEIKLEKKIMAKIPSINLMSENTLFPLFNVIKDNFLISSNLLNQKKLCAFEESIGVVFTYRFKAEKFEIEKLKFTIKYLSNKQINVLTSISYGDALLEPIKGKNLITSQSCFVKGN